MGTLAKKVPNESERKPSAYLTQNVSKRSIAEYIKAQRVLREELHLSVLLKGTTSYHFV